MLSKLYRGWLHLRGYRWQPPFRHPLEVHKPRPGRDPEQIKRRILRQARLQAHIDYHREVIQNPAKQKLEREGRELAAQLAELQLKQSHAEHELNTVIEDCWLAVDRVFYAAGL